MISEDGPSFITLRYSTPRAAKEYRCDACGLPISKGKQHRYHVIIDEDNKLCTTRCHIVCPWESEAP